MMTKLTGYGLLVTLLIIFGCKDEVNTQPTVSFVQPIFFLTKSDTLEIRAYLSEPAQQTIDFPLTIGGTATNEVDYTLSSDKIQILQGDTEGTVDILPKDNVVEQKEIRLEIQPGQGYQTGAHPVAFVPVETNDILTCSFTQPVFEISNYSSISMLLYLGTRTYSRPGMDIYIPFEIDPSSTAVLNEHFEFETDTLALKLGAIAASASVSIRPLKVEAGKNKIVLRLVESARFRPGLYNKTTVTLLAKTDD